MVGGNSHRSWYIQPTYVRQRACAHHPATSGQPAEGLRAQGCAHTSSSAPTQGHRSLTSPASWRSGRGEHQPAPAPPAQPQPAVTAGSQGQPASVRAGCCSARGHEGWLLLSQGSEGGLGQSPRQMVGWDPAGRAGGRLLRSMRNETSSAAARPGRHTRSVPQDSIMQCPEDRRGDRRARAPRTDPGRAAAGIGNSYTCRRPAAAEAARARDTRARCYEHGAKTE